MDTELRNQFFAWLETRGATFPDDDFLGLCLDEALDLISKSRINGLPFADYYSHGEMMQRILRHLQSSAKGLLEAAHPSTGITYRGYPLRKLYPRREALFALLDQLDSQCSK